MRRATRKRVLKGGTIVFNNRSSTLSCTVRDISETGARLRVQKDQLVPSDFDLMIEVDGLEAPCSVAWRRGEEFGVVFRAPPTRVKHGRTQVVTAVTRNAGPLLRRRP